MQLIKIGKDLINKNNLVCLLIIIAIFSLDRVSKIKIIDYLLKEDRVYINDFLNFDLIWNTGVGFGLLSSNSNIIYNSITLFIGFIILYLVFLIYKSKLLDKILFCVIIGGALGNFYDRLIYFAVPDFIDLHYQNFHWFTFNVADIFITIGILILLTKELFFKNEKI